MIETVRREATMDYRKIINGYEHRQVKLRAQISSLKRGKLLKSLGTDTGAAIRRTERQIMDLERAITRCRANQHQS